MFSSFWSFSEMVLEIMEYKWGEPICRKTPNKCDLVLELYLSQFTALSWWRGLHNSLKLWVVLCRATQDGWVIAERSDRMWSTGGGNGNPLQYTCHENFMNCIKGQKDMTPQDESPRSEGVRYGTREKWRRTTNGPRKNDMAGPKRKHCSFKIPSRRERYPLQYSGLENSMDISSMGLQRVGHDWATFTFTGDDSKIQCCKEQYCIGT